MKIVDRNDQPEAAGDFVRTTPGEWQEQKVGCDGLRRSWVVRKWYRKQKLHFQEVWLKRDEKKSEGTYKGEKGWEKLAYVYKMVANS